MENVAIGRALDEIGALLELKGENPFRVRAYRDAARAVAVLEIPIVDMIGADGGLPKIPHVGPGIAPIVVELARSGRSRYHQELLASIPPGLLELVKIPRLGSARARRLCEELGVQGIAELKQAGLEGRVARLKGFGEATQKRLLESIAQLERDSGRFLFAALFDDAVRACEIVQTYPAVRRVSLAGGLRRRSEVVRDIDLVIATDRTDEVAAALARLPGTENVRQDRPDHVSGMLVGAPLDIALVPPERYGHYLHLATGSRAHLEAIRAFAKRRGLLLDDAGLFRGDRAVEPKASNPIVCPDEETLFAALGLPFIEPELREGWGEVEAAEASRLPRLIGWGDLRGIFHNHTTDSDGHAGLEQMVRAAAEARLEYIGISDHSRSAVYARGLSVERVRAQQAEIDALQKRYPQIRIFKGTECDIQADGSLDYNDETLASFDFVIASVHSRFGMDSGAMTARVLRALRHPAVTFLGHATGRRLLTRDPYGIDLLAVIETAREHGVALELNGQPDRLDLEWRACRTAAERGVPVSIHPDAHSIPDLDNIRYGLGIARKAWLSPDQVLNTRSATEIAAWLEHRKASAVP